MAAGERCRMVVGEPGCMVEEASRCKMAGEPECKAGP